MGNLVISPCSRKILVAQMLHWSIVLVPNVSFYSKGCMFALVIHQKPGYCKMCLVMSCHHISWSFVLLSWCGWMPVYMSQNLHHALMTHILSSASACPSVDICVFTSCESHTRTHKLFSSGS